MQIRSVQNLKVVFLSPQYLGPSMQEGRPKRCFVNEWEGSEPSRAEPSRTTTSLKTNLLNVNIQKANFDNFIILKIWKPLI